MKIQEFKSKFEKEFIEEFKIKLDRFCEKEFSDCDFEYDDFEEMFLEEEYSFF